MSSCELPRVRACGAVLSLLVALASAASVQTSTWTVPLDAPALVPRAIAAERLDGALVAGVLTPSAGTTAGASDVLLRRTSPAGATLWTTSLGSTGHDIPHAAWRDASAGFVVAGSTSGVLGGAAFGDLDAWVARFDAAGALSWARQLGTLHYDEARAGCSSGAELFVAGVTNGDIAGPNAGSNDVWLVKLDASGAELWRRQFGSSELDAVSALVDDGAGGVFVVGSTNDGDLAGLIGGWDAWIARVDGAGTTLWLQQFGSDTTDMVNGAASDGAGGLFVAGTTEGDLAGAASYIGSVDAWIARVAATGQRLWTRQLGSSEEDSVAACCRDGEGGAFVIGSTDGVVSGSSAGLRDTWTARLDGAGALVWIRQGDSNAHEQALCGAWDGGRGFYVGGIEEYAGVHTQWLRREYAATLANYCTSSTTTLGCAPRMGATGSPSASASSGFVLRATDVEPQRLGVVFYGLDNGGFTPLPWAAGSTSWFCVRPPTQRGPITNSGGVLAQCTGVISLDWSAFVHAAPGSLGAPFVGGETVNAQAWFRDPTAPRGTNLSDALRFSVLP